MMKKIPVKIPLDGNGSIYDVFNEFIETMELVTGGNVDLECDVNGHITVYFEDDTRPSNKNKSYDIESLMYPDGICYRSDEKSETMSERESKKV